jgi:death-on-curing protein
VPSGEPRFLEVSHVEELHRDQIADTGGLAGFLDCGALESALGSVRNAFYLAYQDVYDIASNYAFAVSKAHAFGDGNKRTALASALLFLAWSECDISQYHNKVLECGMFGLTVDVVNRDQFAEYLRTRALPIATRIVAAKLRYDIAKLRSDLQQFLMRR